VLVADCGPAVTITPAVCPPSVLTLNVAMTPFTFTASGGTAPLTWSVAGLGGTGLGINAVSGVLGGTPVLAGTFPYTVSVQSSDSQIASLDCVFTVPPTPPPTISSGCPVDTLMIVHVPFSFTMTASGGKPPFSWTVSAGALPPGLTIAISTGVISGTPTTAGSYSYTITVVDGLGRQTSVNCSATVHASLLSYPTAYEEFEDNPPVNPVRSWINNGALAIDSDINTAADNNFASSTSTAAGFASLLLSQFSPAPPATPLNFAFHVVVEYHQAVNGGPHHGTSVFNVRNPNPIGFASGDGLIVTLDADYNDTNFSLPASGPFGQDLSKRELVSATQTGASWATNFSSNIANVWFRGAMQDTLNYTLTGQAHYYTYKAWIEFFF